MSASLPRLCSPRPWLRHLKTGWSGCALLVGALLTTGCAIQPSAEVIEAPSVIPLLIALNEAEKVAEYRADPPPSLTGLLEEEQEHNWLFQSDYSEDLDNLVELLLASQPESPLVSAALTHLGVRYRWGGTDPARGFDCSGLVLYAARQSLGLSLPRTAANQAHIGEPVEQRELQEGDLVFFNTRGHRYSHVGIYVGEDKFVHAPRTGAVVRIESIKSRYWSQRYTGARRLASAQVAWQ